MLEGVPNFALAFGYTNASWTLKCGPHLRLRVPPAQPHARHRPAAVHAASTRPVGRARPRCSACLRLRPARPSIDCPKQGSTFPWQVHQSYLADYRLLKRRPLDDEVMEFSNPAPAVGAAAALAEV